MDRKDVQKVFEASKDKIHELMNIWNSNPDKYDVEKLFDPESIDFENLFIMQYQYENCGCEKNWILFFDLFLANMKFKVYYDYVPQTCMGDPPYKLYKLFVYIHDSKINDAVRSSLIEIHGLSLDLQEIIMDYLPPTIQRCLYYKQQTYGVVGLFDEQQCIRQYLYCPCSDNNEPQNILKFGSKRDGTQVMLTNVIEIMHDYRFRRDDPISTHRYIH